MPNFLSPSTTKFSLTLTPDKNVSFKTKMQKQMNTIDCILEILNKYNCSKRHYIFSQIKINFTDKVEDPKEDFPTIAGSSFSQTARPKQQQQQQLQAQP